MIFKLSYNNQTHLYNKSVSLQSLLSYTKKVFKDLPQSFNYIYQSPKGQMTYVETDADLIGLKYCCSASNDFIVKLTIMKTAKLQQFFFDDQIETLNIIRQNMDEMADNIFIDLEQQADREAVSDYLTETYAKISKKLVKSQQQRIDNEIQKEVETYLEKTFVQICQKITRPQKDSFVAQRLSTKKIVRFSPQKPKMYRSQKTIDELVNEKVLEIIPSLVDKIYLKLEQKLQNKCKGCLKNEIQIEKTIDSQISKRLSLSALKYQNPEQ